MLEKSQATKTNSSNLCSCFHQQTIPILIPSQISQTQTVVQLRSPLLTCWKLISICRSVSWFHSASASEFFECYRDCRCIVFFWLHNFLKMIKIPARTVSQSLSIRFLKKTATLTHENIKLEKRNLIFGYSTAVQRNKQLMRTFIWEEGAVFFLEYPKIYHSTLVSVF